MRRVIAKQIIRKAQCPCRRARRLPDGSRAFPPRRRARLDELGALASCSPAVSRRGRRGSATPAIHRVDGSLSDARKAFKAVDVRNLLAEAPPGT